MIGLMLPPAMLEVSLGAGSRPGPVGQRGRRYQRQPQFAATYAATGKELRGNLRAHSRLTTLIHSFAGQYMYYVVPSMM